MKDLDKRRQAILARLREKKQLASQHVLWKKRRVVVVIRDTQMSA